MRVYVRMGNMNDGGREPHLRLEVAMRDVHRMDVLCLM